MNKMLDRLVPKATASADTSFWKKCSSCGYIDVIGSVGHMVKLCHVVGGVSSCGPCNSFQVGCS